VADSPPILLVLLTLVTLAELALGPPPAVSVSQMLIVCSQTDAPLLPATPPSTHVSPLLLIAGHKCPAGIAKPT
jgi:hypothetical protein